MCFCSKELVAELAHEILKLSSLASKGKARHPRCTGDFTIRRTASKPSVPNVPLCLTSLANLNPNLDLGQLGGQLGRQTLLRLVLQPAAAVIIPTLYRPLTLEWVDRERKSVFAFRLRSWKTSRAKMVSRIVMRFSLVFHFWIVYEELVICKTLAFKCVRNWLFR